jgi:hypothetical protein
MSAQTHRVRPGPFVPLWPRQPWLEYRQFRLPMRTQPAELAARRLEAVWSHGGLTDTERRYLLKAARMLEDADRQLLGATAWYGKADDGQEALARVLQYVAALEQKYGEPLADDESTKGDDVSI